MEQNGSIVHVAMMVVVDMLQNVQCLHSCCNLCLAAMPASQRGLSKAVVAFTIVFKFLLQPWNMVGICRVRNLQPVATLVQVLGTEVMHCQTALPCCCAAML